MTNTEQNLFEELAVDDNVRYWLLSDLCEMYGYKSKTSFLKVVNKSIAVCASLDLNVMDSFIQDRNVDGNYKFTRFACFLIAMNADDKKENVKKARAYLAAFANSVLSEYDALEDIARIELRDEIKTSEKILSSKAQDAGLRNQEFGIFKNEGYRGMYNMNLKQLKLKKKLNSRGTLYDFMAQTELAGNFFRITQTSEKISAYKQKGLDSLKQTAYAVGSEVRVIMEKNSGIKPEDIQLTDHVNDAKKRLKATRQSMLNFDN